MSASNWSVNVNVSAEMSPDRNNRYHIDGVGLQLGLNLPVHLMGVSVIPEHTPNNDSYWKPSYLESDILKPQNKRKEDEIQQTIDGIPIRKVYVTNIKIDVQKQEIFFIFGRFGQIRHIYQGISKNDKFKQFAFITFQNPRDASRVLYQRKFKDFRGRCIYATAADSWHQPKESPDGTIVWQVPRQEPTKQEEESEEDSDQTTGSVVIPEESVINNEKGLNVLNDDCLLHIFSFFSFKELTRVEQVCKRWQGLSYRMWKCLHTLKYSKPTFRGMQPKTPVLEQYLKRCGESLSELDLILPNNAFSENTLAVVAKYCSNLEVLRVSNIQVGNRSLAHLGRRCPKLKELVMEGCAKFTDNDLMSLLPKCPDLNCLDLSQSNGITGRCLLSIQSPIKSLRLWNCGGLQICHLVQALRRMNSSLESLMLSPCGNMHSFELEQIVSAVPYLTSFCLCQSLPHFNTVALTPISRLARLTNLNLSCNSSVADNILIAIVDGCESLNVVNLSGITGCWTGSGDGSGCLTERGLSSLARLRKLTDLDISYMEATTDMVLKSISGRNARLKRLICRGCSDITDDGATQIVAMCNELELFDLSGCQQIAFLTVSAAAASVKIRTNSVPLKLIVGGTDIEVLEPNFSCPLLTVDLSDLCEEHLRPDFINNMFFPPSDSEDDEDLDHLCERIGCDCDFDFDDLFDPTLHCYEDSLNYGPYHLDEYLDPDFIGCEDYEEDN